MLITTRSGDGIAIGQLSPGPVVMTTVFVGYALMLEVSGEVLWIAVVGVILGTTAVLAAELFVVETLTLPIEPTGAVMDLFIILPAVVAYWLFVRGVHAAYLIIGGGTIGVGAFFLF